MYYTTAPSLSSVTHSSGFLDYPFCKRKKWKRTSLSKLSGDENKLTFITIVFFDKKNGSMGDVCTEQVKKKGLKF